MILLKKFNIMIWFILIYVVTLILYLIYFYIDMKKGQTLKSYFNEFDDSYILIFCSSMPIINTIIVLVLYFCKIFNIIWNKIKYLEKNNNL